jgi:DNA-binding transcriptional regulator YdaS (Cro superfamily)
MTPTELKATARALWGYGWRRKLATKLGVHEYTVGAWARGKTPIGPLQERAILCVLGHPQPAPSQVIAPPLDGAS